MISWYLIPSWLCGIMFTLLAVREQVVYTYSIVYVLYTILAVSLIVISGILTLFTYIKLGIDELGGN